MSLLDRTLLTPLLVTLHAGYAISNLIERIQRNDSQQVAGPSASSTSIPNHVAVALVLPSHLQSQSQVQGKRQSATLGELLERRLSSRGVGGTETRKGKGKQKEIEPPEEEWVSALEEELVQVVLGLVKWASERGVDRLSVCSEEGLLQPLLPLLLPKLIAHPPSPPVSSNNSISGSGSGSSSKALPNGNGNGLISRSEGSRNLDPGLYQDNNSSSPIRGGSRGRGIRGEEQEDNEEEDVEEDSASASGSASGDASFEVISNPSTNSSSPSTEENDLDLPRIEGEPGQDGQGGRDGQAGEDGQARRDGKLQERITTLTIWPDLFDILEPERPYPPSSFLSTTNSKIHSNSSSSIFPHKHSHNLKPLILHILPPSAASEEKLVGIARELILRNEGREGGEGEGDLVEGVRDSRQEGGGRAIGGGGEDAVSVEEVREMMIESMADSPDPDLLLIHHLSIQSLSTTGTATATATPKFSSSSTSSSFSYPDSQSHSTAATIPTAASTSTFKSFLTHYLPTQPMELHNYPFWTMRITELYHIPPPKAFIFPTLFSSSPNSSTFSLTDLLAQIINPHYYLSKTMRSRSRSRFSSIRKSLPLSSSSSLRQQEQAEQLLQSRKESRIRDFEGKWDLALRRWEKVEQRLGR